MNLFGVLCKDKDMYHLFNKGVVYDVIEIKEIMKTIMYRFSHVKGWFNENDFELFKEDQVRSDESEDNPKR